MSISLKLSFVIALLVASSLSVEVSQSTNVEESKILELKNSNLGGSLMLLAELNNASQAPMDDLIVAVQELVSDIEARTSDLNEEFNARTNRYQSEQTRLGDLISDATIDVSNNSEALQNTLYPGLELLGQKIDSLGNNIQENTEYIETITTQRANSNSSYNDRVTEKNDALKAVDECIEIIKQVSGGNISLAENADAIQESIQRVVDKIKEKSTDADLVKVLAEMAMQKFADMSALLSVSHALGDMKISILKDLQLEHDDENRQLTDFLSEKKEKESEIREFQKNLILLQSDLKTQQEKIAQTENFVDIRKGDQKNFQTQFDSEEQSFEAATATYHDILAQLEQEEAIANDTLQMIQNAGFAQFLNNRVN